MQNLEQQVVYNQEAVANIKSYAPHAEIKPFGNQQSGFYSLKTLKTNIRATDKTRLAKLGEAGFPQTNV